MRQLSKWDHDSAVVADPILVPVNAKNAARLPTSASKQLKVVDLPSEKQATHPLLPKMRLLAVRLSGKQSETEKFQTILQKLSQSRGDTHSQNMKQSLKIGNNMHYQGRKIPLIHL